MLRDKKTILERRNIFLYSNKLTEALCNAIMMTEDTLYLFHKYAKQHGVKTCLVFLVPDEVLFTLPGQNTRRSFVVKAELQPINYFTSNFKTPDNVR